MFANKQKVGVQANRKYFRLGVAVVVAIFGLAVSIFAWKMLNDYRAHNSPASVGEIMPVANPDQSMQSAQQTTGAMPNGLSNMTPAQPVNGAAVTNVGNMGGGGATNGYTQPAPLVAQNPPVQGSTASYVQQPTGNSDNGQSPADIRKTALVAGQQSGLSPSDFQASSAQSSQTASPAVGGGAPAPTGQAGGMPQSLMGESTYNSQNSQTQKLAFAQGPATSSPDSLGSTLQNPLAALVVSAGSIIPAILQTGIDSDLPGQITAVVSSNVYDTRTGNSILIPQGSKLIGTYDSNVSYGQSRVLMVWNRIVYPNGQYIDLGSMPGADLSGYAGISDQVNNHYIRLYGNALLMSLFSAGIQLSQPQSNNNSANPTSGQIIAGAVGQELGQVGAAQAQKNMNIQPTLNIRPGDGFNVLVTRDIPFAAAYAGDNFVPPTQSGQ